MAVFSPVPINFQEANDYADLEGIKQDLLWIVVTEEKYSAIDMKDIITREAFTFALIIKYARANINGERKWIPKQWIDELPKDYQKDHYKFMALRNKYVAHSVNDFEENYAQVYIKDLTSGHPEFDQISIMHRRVASISTNDVNRLACLAKMLIAKIELQMKKKKDKVEEIARKIPIEELIKHKYPDWGNNVVNTRSRKIIKS